MTLPNHGTDGEYRCPTFPAKEGFTIERVFDGISAVVEPAMCLFLLALHYGSLGIIPRPNNDTPPQPKDIIVLTGDFAQQEFDRAFPDYKSKQ